MRQLPYQEAAATKFSADTPGERGVLSAIEQIDRFDYSGGGSFINEFGMTIVEGSEMLANLKAETWGLEPNSDCTRIWCRGRKDDKPDEAWSE